MSLTPDVLDTPEAKRAFVGRMFDGIASTYDLLNHVLSGGADILWRRQAVENLGAGADWQVLDLATGTGDLAFEAAASGARVVGVDLSRPMLRRACEKEIRRTTGTRFTCGDAERLPFGDETFDGMTIGFGIRNVADLDAGLSEMHRVLRPGGRLVVLEFSRPRAFLLSQLYLLYFKRVLPLIGRLVSGHASAYRYLFESVMRFPEGEDFLRRLDLVGFEARGERRLTLGIATAYLAVRPVTGAEGAGSNSG